MMRAPRVPLLVIDTKTGLCARYARKTKGLVAGVSDVQVDYVGNYILHSRIDS